MSTWIEITRLDVICSFKNRFHNCDAIYVAIIPKGVPGLRTTVLEVHTIPGRNARWSGVVYVLQDCFLMSSLKLFRILFSLLRHSAGFYPRFFGRRKVAHVWTSPDNHGTLKRADTEVSIHGSCLRGLTDCFNSTRNFSLIHNSLLEGLSCYLKSQRLVMFKSRI